METGNQISRRTKLVIYASAFAITTLLAFSQALTEVMEIQRNASSDPLWRPFVNELTGAYAVGVLVPALFLLCNRFPFTGQSFLRVLPVHALAFVAYASAQITLMFGSRFFLYPLFNARLVLDPFWNEILYEMNKQLWAYIVLLTAIHGWRYFSISRRREVENARLEALLAKSQLDHLKMQIHPHFLFNTLNTISSLIHEDADKADRLLTQLSELLRLSISDANRALIPFGDEVRFLDLYHKIMLARYEEDLEIAMDIDAGTLKVEVPPFVLQPLIENAIRYATEKRGGLVWVRGKRVDGRLLLTVADNGPGSSLAWDAMLASGVGLSNTDSRLRNIYDDDYHFVGSNLDGGGFQVTVNLPWRKASVPVTSPREPVLA